MNTSLITWQMRVLSLLIFLTSVFIGKSYIFPAADDLSGILARFALGIEVVWWCVLQGRKRGRPITEGGMLILYMTWPVSVPVYLLYTQGLRGLGIAILGAVVICTGIAIGVSLNPSGIYWG